MIETPILSIGNDENVYTRACDVFGRITNENQQKDLGYSTLVDK